MKFIENTLYVRVENGKPADFFYPVENVPERYRRFRSKTIAEMGFYTIGRPHFSDYSEWAQDGERSITGMAITFRAATNQDLKKLFETWDANVTISEWLEAVEEETTLEKTEVARLRKLAKPYIK